MYCNQNLVFVKVSLTIGTVSYLITDNFSREFCQDYTRQRGYSSWTPPPTFNFLQLVNCNKKHVNKFLLRLLIALPRPGQNVRTSHQSGKALRFVEYSLNSLYEFNKKKQVFRLKVRKDIKTLNEQKLLSKWRKLLLPQRSALYTEVWHFLSTTFLNSKKL